MKIKIFQNNTNPVTELPQPAPGPIGQLWQKFLKLLWPPSTRMKLVVFGVIGIFIIACVVALVMLMRSDDKQITNNPVTIEDENQAASASTGTEPPTNADSPQTTPPSTPSPPTTSPAPPGTTNGGGQSPGEDSSPSGCMGFPDAGCTGYGHTGVKLVDASTVQGLSYLTDGRLVIKTDGQVIDGLDIGVCVEVRAKNVVIKRSRIRGSCSEGTVNARGAAVAAANYTLIQDVEIDGLNQSFTNSGLAGEYFMCERCNIHKSGTHARPGGFAVIKDSYLHDNHYGGNSHNSGLSLHDEGYVDIIHNTIRCDAGSNCSGGVQLYAKDRDLDWLPDKVLRNINIKNNLIFSETGYCINGGWQDGGSTANVQVTNNAFMASPLFPDVTTGCGDLGPTSAWPSAQQMASNGIVWSGNYQYPNQSNVVSPQ